MATANNSRTTSRTAAAKKTAAARPGIVEFRNRTFTIPTSPDDMSIEALEAMEDGNSVRFAREVLGPKQYAVLRETVKNGRDLGEFYQAAIKMWGITPGESSASTD